MATYNYTAINSTGKTIKGIIEGDSARHVRQLLREQLLTPIEVASPNSKKVSKQRWWNRKTNISKPELALITRQLATLLAAALPVAEALQGVAEQNEKPRIKTIILGVRSKVLEGHSLAQSLKQFPNSFSELYCSTIAAGEQTGKLDTILNRLADYTEKQQQIHQKIQQALVYPCLMTIVAIGIVSFLLVFVVPSIVGIFQTSGQDLPRITIILLAISHYTHDYGIYIVILLGILSMLFIKLMRYEHQRNRWHLFLLKIPFLAYTIKTINTSRFARTLAILSSSGVSILEAMNMSANLIKNLPLRNSVKHAAKRVQEGSSINLALKETGYFSPMSLHLIASGERSGCLSEMLERAADNQENEINRLIEMILKLFEPAIILVMGAIVLFIVLAILLPIFSLNQFAI